MKELETLFDKTVAQIEHLLSSKTVVGEPIRIEGYTLIPLVSIGFGLGVGSGTGKMDVRAKGEGEGGGVGAGGGIKPTAVIVVGPEGVSLEPIKGGAASLVEKVAQAFAQPKPEPGTTPAND
jgi:uncharacterized spore protein YtfJ